MAKPPKRPLGATEFLWAYGPPRTTVPRHLPPPPRSRATAFAVMTLDISTSPPTVSHVGVFSEASPSSTNLRDLRQLVVAEGFGVDYEDGLRHLRLALRQPYLAWVLPLLDARARKTLESPR